MIDYDGKGSLKIALVEFLNAFPLYYALKERVIDNDFMFIPKPPSVCAPLLRNQEVDIGNVPIVEYAQSKNYKIIKECCISATKRVKSVILILNKPIHQVKRVKLDKNSNTSVALTKVLFKYKYNLSVDYVENDYDCELVIGDRALERLKTVKEEQVLDLAVEWYKMTSLPFVFATWITNKNITEDTVNLFIKSKEWGVQNIDTICKDFTHLNNLTTLQLCKDYLQNNISYDLTKEKITAIELFFNYAYRCSAIPANNKLEFV